jgi:hypothetical protein
MAEKSPLVFVDGGFSQLPPGDSIDGVAYGSVVAGSGLVGGGNLLTGSKQVDVALATNASGVIFVGDSIGLDGVDIVLAGDAYSSGVVALEQADAALASGVAAQSSATTALASGNAALSTAVNFVDPKFVQFTAASDIRAGYAVGLDDSGRVQTIRSSVDTTTRTFGSPLAFQASATTQLSVAFDSTSNRVVYSYRNNSTAYGLAVVGSISGNTLTYGTPVTFVSQIITGIYSAYDSTNNRVVIAYSNSTNSSYGTAIVGTVSGTSISFGTAVVFRSVGTTVLDCIYDSTSSKIVILYADVGNSNFGTAVVGTVAGTSISFGTAAVFESSASASSFAIARHDSGSNRTVITYTDSNNSNYGTAVVGTISGTSISFGTAVVYSSVNSTTPLGIAYDTVNNKTVISYATSTANATSFIVCTVSGTSISFGTPVAFQGGASGGNENFLVYDSSTGQIVSVHRNAANTGAGAIVLCTVSGTSISFGSPTLFGSTNPYVIKAVYSSTLNRLIIGYQNQPSSQAGTGVVGSTPSSLSPTISSRNNFLGVAQATVASGSTLNVLFPRNIDYNQSGLTPGSFYYLNPTTSGFTTASGQPAIWSGSYNWAPVAKAVSSSGLLLLDTL